VLYYPASTTAVEVDKTGSGLSVAFLKKDAVSWVFGVVDPPSGECRANLVDQLQAHRLSHRMRAVVDAKL
jgi:hypothetical protein